MEEKSTPGKDEPQVLLVPGKRYRFLCHTTIFEGTFVAVFGEWLRFGNIGFQVDKRIVMNFATDKIIYIYEINPSQHGVQKN